MDMPLQFYQHEEEGIGESLVKELSGRKLSLVLGAVRFGSSLAAFGNFEKV